MGRIGELIEDGVRHAVSMLNIYIDPLDYGRRMREEKAEIMAAIKTLDDGVTLDLREGV